MRIVLGLMQPVSVRQQATACLVISILELDAHGVRNLLAIGLVGKLPTAQAPQRAIAKTDIPKDNLVYLVQPPYKKGNRHE